MANTNSNLIANASTSPPTLSEVGKSTGRVRVFQDSFEVAAADIDADGDTVKLARIATNARVISIKVANDDLDAGANVAFNCGLYDTDGNILDEDVYATAVAFQAAAGLTDIVNEVRDISKIGQAVWEDAGDSEDPRGVYDIVLTQTAAAAGAAAGTIAFVIEYAVD